MVKSKKAPRTHSAKKTKEKKQKKSQQPVAAEDVRNWRKLMGLSERDASLRLGLSRGFLRSCEKKGAPLYVGLAMAALRVGLAPFTSEQYANNWIEFKRQPQE